MPNMTDGSSSMMAEIKDGAEHSLSDRAIEEPLEKFTSLKEWCFSILQRHKLLTRVWTDNVYAALEFPDVNDANVSQLCKVCGLSESTLKMLLCDCCEEAFHLSCCKPTLKNLPVGEWYCHSCVRRKMKNFGKNYFGGPSIKRSPISFMLKDGQSFTSKVRIGEDFQAAIPDWSGPINSGHACAGELMDPAELSNEDFFAYKPVKPNFLGNWVQCREMINKAEGIRCGKWRRAPFNVVQTDDWDCYSSVQWDPLHSDCAVPQELETEVVLKHLKLIKKLRNRLKSKKSGLI